MLVMLLGATALVRWDIAARREAFAVDARIAHRMLSQRAAQLDAVLATLMLVAQEPDAVGVGRALTLSPRTVETHRTHLSAKLQVQTLAQMIRAYAQLVDEEAAARPASPQPPSA